MWEEKFGTSAGVQSVLSIYWVHLLNTVQVFFSPQLFAPETHSACITFVCPPNIWNCWVIQWYIIYVEYLKINNDAIILSCCMYQGNCVKNSNQPVNYMDLSKLYPALQKLFANICLRTSTNHLHVIHSRRTSWLQRQ